MKGKYKYELNLSFKAWFLFKLQSNRIVDVDKLI